MVKRGVMGDSESGGRRNGGRECSEARACDTGKQSKGRPGRWKLSGKNLGQNVSEIWTIFSGEVRIGLLARGRERQRERERAQKLNIKE